MDPLTAIGLVSGAIELFVKLEPVAAKLIGNLKPLAIAMFEKFTGKPITDDDRLDLETRIDVMHEYFQRPIPPENER